VKPTPIIISAARATSSGGSLIETTTPSQQAHGVCQQRGAWPAQYQRRAASSACPTREPDFGRNQAGYSVAMEKIVLCVVVPRLHLDHRVAKRLPHGVQHHVDVERFLHDGLHQV